MYIYIYKTVRISLIETSRKQIQLLDTTIQSKVQLCQVKYIIIISHIYNTVIAIYSVKT